MSCPTRPTLAMYAKENYDSHIPMQMQGTGPGYMTIPHMHQQSLNQEAGTGPHDFSQPPTSQPFDKCPVYCSIFAMLCCPITFCCSFPALIFSLCSYSDYRVHDMYQFRRKIDRARHLVIVACLVGLILCVGSAVLIFIYYDLILTVLGDIIVVARKRFQAGTPNT